MSEQAEEMERIEAAQRKREAKLVFNFGITFRANFTKRRSLCMKC